MRVKIDIETATFVRFLLVVAAFVAAFFVFYKLWSALILIGIAAFLAIALNPPVSWLSRRLPHVGRVGATAIAYLIVLALLGTLAFLAVPPVIHQTNAFIQEFPGYVKQLSGHGSPFSGLIQQYHLQAQLDQFVNDAKRQVGLLAGGVGGSLVVGVASALNGAVTILTVLVLTFLMLIEGPTWLERIWTLYSNSQRLDRHHNILHKMYRVVTGYVNGQLLVAAIAGASALLAVLILSFFFPIPSTAAIPLAGIVFLFDLIPMVGATVGAAIVVVVLAINSLWAALIFVIYFLIYQQIENNLLQPTIQSRTVELSALSVFVAVILGVTVFGILGGVIAIPIAGCIRVLVIDILERRQAVTSKKSRLAKKA